MKNVVWTPGNECILGSFPGNNELPYSWSLRYEGKRGWRVESRIGNFRGFDRPWEIKPSLLEAVMFVEEQWTDIYDSFS